MKIDVHNHIYPESYLRELEKHGPKVDLEMEKDSWDRKILVHKGNQVVTITPPMYNVQQRLEDMDKIGFDTQILTMSAPSVDIFPKEIARDMARTFNDEIAGICREHPDRFIGFASLPFLDPDSCLTELKHCIEDLGFKGAAIGSNINGTDLDDPLLYPFYEKISEYDLPIHIHPRTPKDTQTYKDYRLAPMFGFEMDLCVAVVRLIMGGVMDKFPGLKFIVSHLGGAIPYLAERIQNCYEAYPECQKNVQGPAKEYLKRFYYDTVSFFQPALMCAYSFLGAGRMILGSDYPHVIGDIEEAVTSIQDLDIPESEKEMIFSTNILNLMHMQA